MQIYNEQRFIRLKTDGDRNNQKQPINKINSTYNDIASHPNKGMSLKDMVLIDFDTQYDAERALNYVNNHQIDCLIAHTGKGVHLYFKPPMYTPTNKKTPQPLPLKNISKVLFAGGLTGDIKTGENNYGVIDFAPDGGNRLDTSRDFDSTSLSELPKYFWPAKTQTALDWEEGSRNDSYGQLIAALYNMEPHMELDEAQTFLLTEVNPYTLTNPQDQTALTTQVQSLYKNFKPKESSSLSTEQHIHRLQNDVNFYTYNKRLYMETSPNTFTDDKDIIEEMLLTQYNLDKRHQRAEVYEGLRLTSEKINNLDPYTVKTNTGAYSIESQTWQPTTQNFNIHSLKHDYDVNAYDADVDQFLNEISCNKPDVRQEILESLATGIIPASPRQLFIFKGAGKNGKGMLMKLYTSIFENKRSIARESLEMLSGNDFAASTLTDKLINVSDELEAGVLEGSATLKSIISGEEIHASKKGEDRKPVQFYATLFLLTNHQLKNKDKSQALADRIKFIPMNHRFTDVAPMKAALIEKKLTSDNAQKYLIKLLFDALETYFNTPTMSEESQLMFNEFMEERDPAGAYVMDKGIDFFKNKSTMEVHGQYQADMALNNLPSVSIRVFNTKIKTLLPTLVTKNATRQGQSVQIWEEVQ